MMVVSSSSTFSSRPRLSKSFFCSRAARYPLWSSSAFTVSSSGSVSTRSPMPEIMAANCSSWAAFLERGAYCPAVASTSKRGMPSVSPISTAVLTVASPMPRLGSLMTRRSRRASLGLFTTLR